MTPYLVEIMDACSDPTVERVVIKKSAQIGYTDGILNNLVGYYIDQLPSPILMLQPTVEAANNWSKERLATMLRDTPQLRGRVKESGRRDAENTLRLKIFPGGYLAIVGANSAVGLRSRPIRVLLADEIDAYKPSAKGGQNLEGDPIELAITRTQNFADRKIISGSTPTIKGSSHVERDYDLSDQRLFFVPCPHCGYRQVLRWKNFRWEHRDPLTTVYLCGDISEHGELTAGCGRPILEEDKATMVAAGRWIPQRPGRPIRGYFIWAAYSLFLPWPKIVERWLGVGPDTERLQQFVNQVLGECWEDKGEQVEFGTLEARRETYAAEVPLGVGLLTAGVDVQGDRLEVSVWGWGKGDESWLVRHETFWGNPVEEAPWRQLDLFRTKVWQHAGGAELKIVATAVDSGGHHTDQVYRYGKSRKGVFVVKGSSESGAAPVGRPSKHNRAGVALFPVGTVALKDSLYGRLKITALGPGFVHLPQVDEEYLRQLTAEAVRTRFEKGRMAVRRYEKVYERNEALDCAVYARAALLILGPLREQLGVLVDRLQPKGPTPAPDAPKGVQVPKKPPRRGGWVNRW
jgi:phage terminase large subunit GpA-like protein